MASVGKVMCDGYCYWTDIPLEVGDKVLVSVSSGFSVVFGSTCERTVSGFGSSYSGPMQRVIKKLTVVDLRKRRKEEAKSIRESIKFYKERAKEDTPWLAGTDLIKHRRSIQNTLNKLAEKLRLVVTEQKALTPVETKEQPMLKKDIKVGGTYTMKVSGGIVPVRVNAIREVEGYHSPGTKGRTKTVYDCTNLKTGRDCRAHSAAKFRGEVNAKNQSIILPPTAKVEAAKAPANPTSSAGQPTRPLKGSSILNTSAKSKGSTPPSSLTGSVRNQPTTATATTPASLPAAAVAPTATQEIVGECPDCGEEIEYTPGEEVLCGGCGFRWKTRSQPCPPKTSVTPVTATAKPTTTTGRSLATPSTATSPPATTGTASSNGASAPSAAPSSPSGLTAKLKAMDQAEANQPPHLVIVARAGTGKTTTLVSALQVLKGIKPMTATGQPMQPSPQQQAIWDSVAQSKDAKSVCFVAFNKSIATELQRRVPAGCEAMTMHSLGYKAVTKALGRMEPNGFTVHDHVCQLLGDTQQNLARKRPGLVTAAVELVGLCKVNLIDAGNELQWRNELDRLVSYYDIELEGRRDQDDIYELVPKVLELCKSPKGKINFDDMIWLPVILDLPVTKYDLLLVDEAQDLNRCQQALAKKAGRRLVLCGDPKQAIYGFAGADCESMTRMAEELGGGWKDDALHPEYPQADPKCVTLPLTVTRRCGKAIVAEAQRFVADFEAHESNPEGLISEARYPTDGEGRDRPQPHYLDRVKDGDMVLCRCNAPLVSQCFKFLKRGRKANIQGRNIGQGLVRLVEKLMKGYSPGMGVYTAVTENGSEEQPSVPMEIVELHQRVSAWADTEEAKERASKYPNDNKLAAIRDKADCLHCFTEGAKTTADVVRKINDVFTDDKAAPGIRLSSIHKAKGLEADTVYLIRIKGAECPHPMAKTPWAREQENNLLYVATTRAINELVHVS